MMTIDLQALDKLNKVIQPKLNIMWRHQMTVSQEQEHFI